jgi:hypothetical protein
MISRELLTIPSLIVTIWGIISRAGKVDEPPLHSLLKYICSIGLQTVPEQVLAFYNSLNKDDQRLLLGIDNMYFSRFVGKKAELDESILRMYI